MAEQQAIKPDIDMMMQGLDDTLLQGGDGEAFLKSQGWTLDEYKSAVKARKAGGGAKPAQPAGPPMSIDQMAADARQSAVTGATRGVVGLPGMAGDADQLISGIVSWTAGKLGATPETQEALKQEILNYKGPFPQLQEAIGQGTDAARQAVGLNPAKQLQAPTSEQVIDYVGQQMPGLEPTLSYEPKTGVGAFTRNLGETATGLIGKGKAVTKAAEWLGGGLGEEALGSATAGTWMEPYARAAGQMIGTVTGHYGSPAGPTAEELLRAQTKGATAQDMQNFRNLGPEARTYNFSPSTRSLAQGAVLKPGPAKDIITRSVDEQMDRRSERLIGDKQRVMGTGMDPFLAKMDLLDQATAQAAPYRAQARAAANFPPDMITQLHPVLEQHAIRLPETLRTPFMNEFDNISDALLHGDQQMAFDRLWGTRKELDARITWDAEAEKALDPSGRDVNNALKGIRKEVDNMLKSLPGMREADDYVSTAIKQAEDIEYGAHAALGRGEHGESPNKFEWQLSRRAPPRDPDAVAAGMSYRVDNALGTNANDLAALRPMVGAENDWNRAKISRAFGPQAAEQMGQSVKREEHFSRDAPKITAGSDTAERLAAEKIVDAMDPKVPTNLTWMGVVGRGGQKVAQAVVDKVFRGRQTSKMETLARALTAQGRDAEDLIRRAQSTNSETANVARQAIVNALLSTAASRVGSVQQQRNEQRARAKQLQEQ